MNPKIEILISDITKISADAIVNSANTALIKGSGICKTIYKKREASPRLLRSFYNLPSSFFAHLRQLIATAGKKVLRFTRNNQWYIA